MGDGAEGGPHGMRMDSESWSSSEMAGLVGGCGGRAGSARGAEKEKKDCRRAERFWESPSASREEWRRSGGAACIGRVWAAAPGMSTSRLRLQARRGGGRGGRRDVTRPISRASRRCAPPFLSGKGLTPGESGCHHRHLASHQTLTLKHVCSILCGPCFTSLLAPPGASENEDPHCIHLTLNQHSESRMPVPSPSGR